MKELLEILVALASSGGGAATFVVGGVLMTIAVSVGKRVLFSIITDRGDQFNGELPHMDGGSQ